MNLINTSVSEGSFEVSVKELQIRVLCRGDMRRATA